MIQALWFCIRGTRNLFSRDHARVYINCYKFVSQRNSYSCLKTTLIFLFWLIFLLNLSSVWSVNLFFIKPQFCIFAPYTSSISHSQSTIMLFKQQMLHVADKMTVIAARLSLETSNHTNSYFYFDRTQNLLTYSTICMFRSDMTMFKEVHVILNGITTSGLIPTWLNGLGMRKPF